MKLQPALYFSHTLLSQVIQSGDIVIDGTVGNGNDTAFLADQVGKNGHVYGFDIQALAIDNTEKRLNAAHLMQPVELFQTGHENIDQVVPIDTPIAAAIFNLGYLPGGDHQKITTADTTIPAVKACLSRLTKNGIVALVLYYGHPGGPAEKQTVIQFVEQLDQKQYTVLNYQFINQVNQPPILIAIQKR
ncbi:class I SAM-dependent methyltransferase [Nicoliella lavandulae]|uniref:Class I SAM-dependent methyltransferase n=1 Tax=Nicoliella lavandulae TaxID=3082954 RepID=A0ABU8SKQ4_9LACO